MVFIKSLIKKTIPERIRREIRLAFYQYIRRRIYFGNHVLCILCGGTFSRFLPYGDFNIKDGVLCPGCHSLPRQRSLWSYLERRLKWLDVRRRPLRILHFAPHHRIEARLKRSARLDYRSCDLNPAVAMEKQNISCIGYPDSIFDFVLCSHVLYLIEDDVGALAEIYRVLKPGGAALIQDAVEIDSPVSVSRSSAPEAFWLRYGHTLLKTHAHLYGHDLKQRIGVSGFQVAEVHPCGNLDVLDKRRMGVFDDEDVVYVCRKPRT